MIRRELKQLVTVVMLAASSAVHAESFYRYVDGDTLEHSGRYSFIMRSGLQSAVVEVRGAVPDNREGHGAASARWGIGWRNSEGDSLSVNIGWGNTAFATDYDSRYLRLSVFSNDTLKWSSDFVKNVNLAGGYNSLLLSFSSDGSLCIGIGDRYVSEVTSVAVGGFPHGAVSIGGSDKFRIRNLIVKEVLDLGPVLATDWTLRSITDYLHSSKDPVEGVWEYLDRDNDMSQAVMGGRYQFATIRNGARYDIIYLAGAVTMADRWVEGMKKGELVPTIFMNDFNLVWYDSLMERMDKMDEISASLTDNDILTLRFPLLSTQIRFSRKRF